MTRAQAGKGGDVEAKLAAQDKRLGVMEAGGSDDNHRPST
jgi:hypothetical protein